VVEPVPAVRSPAPVVSPFGRPTAQELVEAVEEYLERGVTDKGEAGARFEARVARNVLRTVARQLDLGPTIGEAHARRLAQLGFDDDRMLASAIRSGEFDEGWHDVGVALATSARDQLLVANPSYLDATGPSTA